MLGARSFSLSTLVAVNAARMIVEALAMGKYNNVVNPAVLKA